jgi:hypothetical protein
VDVIQKTTLLDRVNFGVMGRGHNGIHFEVINEVQRYDKVPNSYEEALSTLNQLLKEYEEKHLGSQKHSD